MTVINTSIGSFDFGIFELISASDNFLKLFGDLYTIAIVIIFKILILNFIIAILSNTYSLFDTKSQGLYLSKILNTRDEMKYDENYSAFLLVMAPLNIFVVPFVPYAMLTKPNRKINNFLSTIQYSFYIIIVYSVFAICSLLMIPIAFLKPLTHKFHTLLKASSFKTRIVAFIDFTVYAFLGIPLLIMCMFSDFYYFWANNFRSNLKKIIIERNKSTLSNKTLRQIKDYCAYYSYMKIKSILTTNSVKQFREKFNVTQNIRYLIFG